MARGRGNTVTDRVFLARACELAQRGLGSTAPNPAVGAVIVRDERTLGEGYHHERGAAHAEVEALRAARDRGHDVRGATLYVSLEPCDRHGVTPPCTEAILSAGIARVVIGAMDPNPKTNGAGVQRLAAANLDVQVMDFPWARRLVESFEVAIRASRPYVALKMAASLDGYVAPQEGSHWLTGPASRERVRELRYWHDAVMIGAGTARIDDPQLTVRPHVTRRKPYTRVVVCETDAIPPHSRVLAPPPGAPEDAYRPTIVLAPGGAHERFAAIEPLAEVVYVGDGAATQLDLREAMLALRARDITTVLCEGGPTLAGRLLDRGLVQRATWLVAPVFLRGAQAVPALGGVAIPADGWTVTGTERVGDDVLVTTDLTCSPD